MVLVLLLGCANQDITQTSSFVFPAQPQGDAAIKQAELDSVEQPAELVSLLPYKGKYRHEPKLKQLLLEIPQISQTTISKIAEYTGFSYTELGKIIVKVSDWNAKDHPQHQVVRVAGQGQHQWEIRLVAEFLFTGKDALNLVFPRLLFTAIYQQQRPDSLDTIPQWLWQATTWHIVDRSSDTFDYFYLQMLEEQRPLALFIAGLAVPNLEFPGLQGYLGLQFIQAFYSDGAAKLKQLLHNIFWQGKDWEAEFAAILGMPWIAWQDKARNFALSHLQKHYQGTILAYRKILRLYLQKDYATAIPELKKMTFEFSNTFIAGNLLFWLGMCYYRVEQYPAAQEYFQEAIQKFSPQLTYLAEAYYRSALCDFHQSRLATAIPKLSDFARDFPDHDLRPSALFFVGQCLQQQNRMRDAILTYESLAQQYPQHSRTKEALFQAGLLCPKLGWFRTAQQNYEHLLMLQLAPEEQQQTQANLSALVETQKNPIPQDLAKQLDNQISHFQSKPKAEQQMILEECSRIGEHSLPWLEKLADLISPDLIQNLIQSAVQMQSSKAARVLLHTLRKYPEQSNALLLGLIQLQIPMQFLQEWVQSAITNLPAAQQTKITQQLEMVLWDITPAMQEKLPYILVYLNSSAAKQAQVVEQLALGFGIEQVPVLARLARYGASPEVRIQALENLVEWQDEKSSPLLAQLLLDTNPQIQIAALLGLAQMKQYPWPEFAKLLRIAQRETKLTLLDVLAASESSMAWPIMIQAIEDDDLIIRDRAKQTLRQMPSQTLLPLIIPKFIENGHAVYFYMALAKLLQEVTKSNIPFEPEMTQEQRKQLISKFQP